MGYVPQSLHSLGDVCRGRWAVPLPPPLRLTAAALKPVCRARASPPLSSLPSPRLPAGEQGGGCGRSPPALLAEDSSSSVAAAKEELAAARALAAPDCGAFAFSGTGDAGLRCAEWHVTGCYLDSECYWTLFIGHLVATSSSAATYQKCCDLLNSGKTDRRGVLRRRQGGQDRRGDPQH